MSRSAGEDALALELTAAGIPFEREVRFAPPRRWRFDFALSDSKIAVEVEGGAWTGGHKRGRAADSDCEKSNAAALLGWKVLRFTPAMVESGEAMRSIREAWNWPLSAEMTDGKVG